MPAALILFIAGQVHPTRRCAWTWRLEALIIDAGISIN